jgi:hypothetical protein
MFIPLKDLNPRRSYPFVNTALILINIGVFIYQVTLPSRVFKAFVLANATVPARFPAVLSGHGHWEAALVPVLTSMFLHGGVAHLLGNMLFLWIFGDNVEDFYGHVGYLFFLFVLRCRGRVPAHRVQLALDASVDWCERGDLPCDGSVSSALSACANTDARVHLSCADPGRRDPCALVCAAVCFGSVVVRRGGVVWRCGLVGARRWIFDGDVHYECRPSTIRVLVEDC